jgi:hypothetical protein
MGSMSDNEEERRVKSRLDRDVSQYYQRISYKKTVSRKDLPRDNMTIESAHESTGEEESSDKDVEDETYIPSPRAPHHRKGKIIASVGGSGAARDEEESKRGDEHGDEAAHIYKEEVFDVEEIIPQAYVHMEIPCFQQTQNPGWRQKVSYKGKIEAMREKRKENPRLKQREVTHYRFHTFFQQDLSL